jgi:ABC-type Fe3+ transport system permease subunit
MLLLKPAGFETLATKIYQIQKHSLFDYEYAQYAVVLIVISLLVLVIDGGKRYE